MSGYPGTEVSFVIRWKHFCIQGILVIDIEINFVRPLLRCIADYRNHDALYRIAGKRIIYMLFCVEQLKKAGIPS